MCCTGPQWANRREIYSHASCAAAARQAGGGDITMLMPDCVAFYAYCKCALFKFLKMIANLENYSTLL